MNAGTIDRSREPKGVKQVWGEIMSLLSVIMSLNCLWDI